MKSWYKIRARTSGTEVLIYDEIGAYGVTAKGFLAELGALPEDAAIDLRLNSPGGSVFDAVAIYNALKRHTGEITVWIDDIAASAASYIAMAGDEIVISTMEHHSNIVPWQLLCEQVGARLCVAPIDDHGTLQLDEFQRLISPRTRLVAVVHLSNSLGTINPVKNIVRMAHARGVPVLIDGSQSVYHMPVDVQDLDCDFYVFTGHKLYGPTGIGVLYGRESLLEQMPPYQGGGDMIRSVTFEKTTYAELPHKFEAGTPHIAGAIGLGAAVDYLLNIGFEGIGRHEADLLAYATNALSEVKGLQLIGTSPNKASILSFVMDGAHPHDIGTIVDSDGIAIRTGHHCTQPVMDRFGVPATARASMAMYNTHEEIDALVKALEHVRETFSV